MRDNKGHFIKGTLPWNTGSKNGSHYSDEARQKMSLAKRGKPSKKRGIPLTEEHKRKIVETREHNGSYLRGEKSPWWKGGDVYLNENDKARKSPEYKIWRRAVFVRDDFTCVWCGLKGGRLNADHIKPFSLFPDLRFTLGNGRTLCIPCHKKTDTYGNKIRKVFWTPEIYKLYLRIAYGNE